MSIWLQIPLLTAALGWLTAMVGMARMVFGPRGPGWDGKTSWAVWSEKQGERDQLQDWNAFFSIENRAPRLMFLRGMGLFAASIVSLVIAAAIVGLPHSS